MRKNARCYRKYEAPKMTVTIVYMEKGIVAASATITPGGPGATNYNPEVEDWVIEGSQSGTLDM